MVTPRLTIAFTWLLALMAARPVSAQTFQITSHVIGGGGGPATGGSFALGGTIGQPDASAADGLSGANYSISGGFWSTPAPLCQTFTAADFNHDCLVDAADVAAFIACAGGATIPLALECQMVDLDGDSDADADDFGILQRCYRGSAQAADLSCGCPGGATLCSGVCTNTAFDTQNCGGCGIVCPATCSGGVCQDGW